LRAQSGGCVSIRGRIRGGDDHDRKVLEFTTRANFPQHFESVDPREIEVQQQQLRAWRLWIVLGFHNYVKRPLTIWHYMNVQRQIFHPDRIAYQKSVGQIVLCQ
jgi:hypothetical protein